MARLSYNPLQLGRLIADVWANASHRYALLTQPVTVLTAAGVDVPANHVVVVHEDTESTTHIVIPRRPAQLKLDDDYLTHVGNGMLDGCDMGYKPPLPQTR